MSVMPEMALFSHFVSDMTRTSHFGIRLKKWHMVNAISNGSEHHLNPRGMALPIQYPFSGI
jgi:hypothetical protein